MCVCVCVDTGADWSLGTMRGHAFWMLVTGTFLILSGALFWMVTDGNADYEPNFRDALWLSWGCFFDPGL